MKKKARRTRPSGEQRIQRWLRRHYTPERIEEALALPLRRDMVTLLEYVRDHKVVGTTSTGNMPLKAVREVTAQFVDPPVLDYSIGKYTRKLRSEYDIWPLHFLHILAEVGDLLWAEPGRKWRLLPQVAQFFEMDALFQLAYLLYVWWFQVNWLVAYPVGGLGDALPGDIERVTLARLRAIRPQTQVPFAEFADGLIEATGLTWTAPDMSHARMLLRGAVQRMVIRILDDFGAVRGVYRPNPGLPGYEKLDAFEITPLGVALLDSLFIEGG